jgi:hypothetical protein
MSRMKNGGERCDVCGKLTRSKDGYYLKPDGVNAGYMHSQEWYGIKAEDDGTDICEECAAEVCTRMQGKEPIAGQERSGQ